MGEFYEGKITIDQNLYLVKEDGEIFNHFKLDMYAPLSDAIHSDDLAQFETMISVALNDIAEQFSCVRVLCQDNTYHWFLIRAVKEAFEFKGQDVLTLHISDCIMQSDFIELLKERNSYNDVFLQMLDGILLCYDRDIDYLDIFTQKDNHHISFFSGSISKWKQDCMQGKIAKRDMRAYLDFCDDLEAGRSGCYDILTSSFSDQNKESLFAFKCALLNGQNQIVLGCIVPHSQNSANFLGNAYEKDVGIDALNKKAITEYAKRTIHAAGKHRVYIGIIDLDNFKTINDTFGHLFGDEVLRVAADIINKALGTRGMLGRIGGDELMIVVDQISDYTELRNLLRTIRTNIEWAYKGKRDDIVTTCSIGISCYPDQGLSFEEVFEISDRMLYIAKEKGKNRYVIYTPGLHDNVAQLDSMYSKPQDADVERLKADRLGILQRMVDDYLLRKVITNEGMFREIGLGYDLQEILFVSEENAFILQWVPEGTHYDIDTVDAFYMDDELGQYFDAHGMYVMNNYSFIEGKSPAIADALKKRGVQTAIFYRLQHSTGYIMFARSNSRHLWSESETMAFAIIAKTLEVAIMNR